MARKYNPHEVHPITYIFVGFILLLTLVGVSSSFNKKPRTLDSSAQTYIHKTPTPISDCVSCTTRTTAKYIYCKNQTTRCTETVKFKDCTGNSCDELLHSDSCKFVWSICLDGDVCERKSDCPDKYSCYNAGYSSGKDCGRIF